MKMLDFCTYLLVYRPATTTAPYHCARHLRPRCAAAGIPLVVAFLKKKKSSYVNVSMRKLHRTRARSPRARAFARARRACWGLSFPPRITLQLVRVRSLWPHALRQDYISHMCVLWPHARRAGTGMGQQHTHVCVKRRYTQ